MWPNVVPCACTEWLMNGFCVWNSCDNSFHGSPPPISTTEKRTRKMPSLSCFELKCACFQWVSFVWFGFQRQSIPTPFIVSALSTFIPVDPTAALRDGSNLLNRYWARTIQSLWWNSVFLIFTRSLISERWERARSEKSKSAVSSVEPAFGKCVAQKFEKLKNIPTKRHRIETRFSK